MNEQIRDDLERYMKAMAEPDGWTICLAIERKYNLDGYPPQIVAAWMGAEGDKPGSGDAAIDRIFSGEP